MDTCLSTYILHTYMHTHLRILVSYTDMHVDILLASEYTCNHTCVGVQEHSELLLNADAWVYDLEIIPGALNSIKVPLYSPTHLLTYSPTHLLTYSPTHLLTSPPPHLPLCLLRHMRMHV